MAHHIHAIAYECSTSPIKSNISFDYCTMYKTYMFQLRRLVLLIFKQNVSHFSICLCHCIWYFFYFNFTKWYSR